MSTQHAPHDEPPPAVRDGDIALAILLWLVHAALGFATFVAAMLTAFGTDVCAYEACGNPEWVEVAIVTAMASGCVLLVGSVVVGIRRMRRRRPALPIAAWGCFAQLVMIPIVLAIGGQAGTLD
ncbi:hypothetical protein [Gordonia terrae]|uniref:hypothetical protein n=1 Tax=Gordonia terrae TaxID=2055 RepID=UPI003F6B7239